MATWIVVMNADSTALRVFGSACTKEAAAFVEKLCVQFPGYTRAETRIVEGRRPRVGQRIDRVSSAVIPSERMRVVAGIMTIDTKHPAFLVDYEKGRADLGLPPGSDHWGARSYAMRQAVIAAARYHHHAPSVQGLSFECFRCSMTCSIDPTTAFAVGDLVREACSRGVKP